MTPERIKGFLQYFYSQYIAVCYEGCEVVQDDDSTIDMEPYNVAGYLNANLDIYMEHCNYEREYNQIYNKSMFQQNRTETPEPFNELQIFLIENIQMFFHAMLGAVVKEKLAKDKNVKEIIIKFRQIDNEKINFREMVYAAEDNMKSNGLMPPSMG
jgi:hypothetical protein